MATVHIVGAGMAGLACAVDLAKAGRKVIVHEAARRAGGRCRSFYDETLDRVIDNGNHLILGANPAVFAYLDTLGARDGLAGQDEAAFPFVDLVSGTRWTVRPNAGRLPWWIFAPSRRIPGTRWTEYLAGLRLAWARRTATVADCVGTESALAKRLWQPLTVAVLNAAIDEGAARLLWPVLRLTFGRGEAACRAYVARSGLGPDLVDPATRYLEAHGGEIRYGRRLRDLAFAGDVLRALDFSDGVEPLDSGDLAVLAVPPAGAKQLLPDISAPLETRAIVNAHFRLNGAVQLPGGGHILGLVGGSAHWLFGRGDIASVTVSAADALAELSSEAIAERLWADVAAALGLQSAPLPPYRIVKEKRATFAQVPASLPLRPSARTRWRNLLLAGDWTDTGLPATIEGAVRSGQTAARIALAR